MLSETAGAIAGGDFSSRARIRRRDELGSLADSVNQMAESIDKLLQAQEQAYLQALKSLTKALQTKDPYTAGHSGRVKHYSLKLGGRLGLDEATLDLLGRGALVHDIGKIGIPDAILNKPAPLDDEEYAVMRQHPTFTAAIMRPLVRFRAFTEIAAWHHERWDGGGYPDGLAGEEVPLLARIVAIADAWDAMTGDRIYRKGMPVEKALGILEAEADDGQFDPDLIRAFTGMIREEIAAGEGDKVARGARRDRSA
jgi:HD-GYP domain-containing protein (c-di-GMP phosphodiesterase class II)